MFLLDEVIYEEEDQYGNKTPKIKAAYDALNAQHLVLRAASADEFEIYKQLEKNPLDGVVAVHSTIKDGGNQVFMKRYDAGNLNDILWDISDGTIQNGFDEEQKRRLAITLIEGLKNLHTIEIEIEIAFGINQKVKLSHRDLKPDNIFCEHFNTPQFSCAIGDFDTAPAYKKISEPLVILHRKTWTFSKGLSKAASLMPTLSSSIKSRDKNLISGR